MLPSLPRMPTRLLVLLLVLGANACRTAPGGGDVQAGRVGEPLEFERLMVGSVFGVGSGFDSDGLSFRIEAFGEGLGNAEIAGALAPQAGSAKSLRLAHASLRCADGAASGLEFDYIDNGAGVAIEIGGERRSAADLIALDGATLGAVAVAVSESSTAGVRRGHVSLKGPIEGFAIAGADLQLADLRLAR